MRELWIEIPEKLTREEKLKLLEACKGRCQAVLVSEELKGEAENLGLSPVLRKAGKIVLVEEDVQPKDLEKLKASGLKVCLKVSVRSRGDEDKIVEAASKGVDYVVASCPDWKVIPLENLIAKIRGKAKLIAEVSNLEEARLALETLELGADGILLRAEKPSEIVEAADLLSKVKTRREEEAEKLKLVKAKITGLKPLGLGMRVCVDTCDIMEPGEGMLVGCQSSGLFLVQAEVEENPHVEPRPFRVNAGPVSLYILAKDGKTKYLSELKAGDELVIVGRDGSLRPTHVGRVKIERRPMLLVEAEIEGSPVKTIVQNAETIRLVTPDGSKSVRELKPGDEVLVYYQPGGRHFGVLVEEETVIER
ncbi:MAG: 3-dehydroquinate synthase II [Candidatus Hecatellaceae archaeon]